VVEAAGDAPVGVNVLRNDAHAALAVALAAGARFVRVNVHTGVAATDQGLIEGRAAETLRTREALGCGPLGPHPVAILADVHVKHAKPMDSDDIAQAAMDTQARGLADGLIVSGSATGSAPELYALEVVHRAVNEVPVWLGSGLDVKHCAELLNKVNGAIVGSACKVDGQACNAVDPARARELVAAVRMGR
jgi:uncharacterized protein